MPVNEFTQRADETGFSTEKFETILDSLLNGNVNQAVEQIQALNRPHLFFAELENHPLNADPAEDGRLKFRLMHGLCSNLLGRFW